MMQIRVFSDLGDRELADAWAALEDAGACPNVFVARDWVAVWSRQFAVGARPVVVVGYDGSEPVGLAPLFAWSDGTARLPVNFISLKGDFLLVAGRAGAFMPAALATLQRLGLRPVLRSLPRESAAFGLAVLHARHAGYYANVRPGRTSPYLDVTTTWQQFLAGLPGTRRRRWDSQFRRLEREGTLEARRLDAEPDIATVVAGLADLETRSWKERQGTSIRGRGLEAFYRDLCGMLRENGWLRAHSLELDGRMIAFLLGASYRGVYFLLKTSYDEAFSKLSPGVCVFYQAMKDAFEERISRVDFLGEQASWKTEWATGQCEQADLLLYPTTARGLGSYLLDTRVKALARRLLRRG
jgi:CelD/BcsL family acetyltransferase involved in cellulose biosynthesis